MVYDLAGCRGDAAGARPGVVPPRSTAGSCSRRHLRRCTAGPRARSRLIGSPLAGAGQDARHLGQQIRPVARYLAELGRRGDFGLGWLTPAGMPLGYAVQAGNEQTVRGGSGAIMGHQAGIERVCDKGKLAKLVFRLRASRKDRRRRLSRPRRRTVCRHWGSDRRRAVLALSGRRRLGGRCPPPRVAHRGS